jgi:hypothetical protein
MTARAVASFLSRAQEQHDMVEPLSDIRVLAAATSGGPRADDRETLADEELLRRYRQTRTTTTFDHVAVHGDR